ncbi:2-dehydropantoate 2-reductase [Rhizobium bangladeshense]|uniref:ketopantoate reductase family protein n=1 Tax=Rhizobium bangladeshense TaxID=1138189 RepID=UPI001C83249A|nr:2-dehydropantoate 2-reductase [Rhizobium bangladeshense]MBX4871038.1 2-dehydropantoate 2-reductase [Rhizobium bangladeshense]MBX4871338.1 2-dehydropantoate 2-reductase [Rhizobium bangladeshense]MBX4887602.1 2-dehydropantoate 2-reductase [Rhizobium bangladeshense]
MRIAVIGAGAMGSLFAGRLAHEDQDVCLIEVSGAMIEAIRGEGLRMTGYFGEQIYRLAVGPADRYANTFELLIVFTKGMHTTSAMEAAKHVIGPDTWALTVQNGIGNVEAIEAFVARDRIIMGMTNWPSTMIGPGLITVPGGGEIKVWAANGQATEKLETISCALDEAGLNCKLDPGVEVAIWEKLAFNSALNSLAAVTGLTVGEMGDRSQSRTIVFTIVEEVVAVARAKGLAVDADHIRNSVEHAFANHRQHKPSMLQDRVAGRRMEIDTITGAVSKVGAALGIATPVTTTFANLLTIVDGEVSRV